MKHFTESDIVRDNHITIESTADLVEALPDWMKRGLMQTRSGYGSRLTTAHKISFCGRLYRVYCTCYSNAGSCWFVSRGRKIFVS